LVGQGLRAALRTADFAPHSLHAYFVRPADPREPVDFSIARLKDGSAFQLRAVEASQAARTVLSMVVSFHRGETGFDYQLGVPGEAGDPESLPPSQGVFGDLRELLGVDIREGTIPPPAADGTMQSSGRLWVRALPHASPGLEPCVLAFVSDLSVHFSIRLPVLGSGLMYERPYVKTSSLDHAIWYHRTARPEDWILYDLQAVSVAGSRGLSRGAMFDRAGRLLASTSQEVLIRADESVPKT
jgi:acyl-CoA thioesterase-2